MAANLDKKAEAELRAKDLYRRLMALKADKEPTLSNNEWTKQAGVSTSFFTNMQGVSKPASEPGVGNLRMVIEKMGSTLPEFFLHEAKGRLVPAPSRQALEQALFDALSRDLPTRTDARVAYLASTVRSLLGLPADLPATPDSTGEIDEGAPVADAPVRRSTKRASRQ